jgi:hypothetical protein
MPPEQNDATQTTTTTPDEYADFSSVFESLTEPKNDSQDSQTDPTDSSAVSEDDAQQQTQQADGAGDSEEPAASGEDSAAADGEGSQDDQGGQSSGGDQGAQDVDWQARFESLQSQFDAFKAGTQQSQPPATQDPTPTPQSVYSADEQAELADLQKEWPDLHRLFSLMARQLQVDTLNYAFSEVGKVIQPLQESVTTYSTNEHTAAIYDAHTDYDAVYQPCMEWIEKQPSFLKAAYQNVAKQGTAEEVITMVQQFKDATGWKAPAAGSKEIGGSRSSTPAAAASAPKQTTGLSEAAKKAAKAMGAVGTKRGGQAAAQDPNDFDGAWDEATAA